MKTYELTPVDNRKSFYGKTYVEVENGTETLYSYHTPIVSVNGNTIKPLWDGWSMTTGRHIDAFFSNLGLNRGIGKRAWGKIQAGEVATLEELEKALN